MKIILPFLVLAVSFFFQLKLDINIDVDLISSLLTVFSIFFGFYVTSFAVFATSKYLHRLYKIEDEDDNTKTLLDTLIVKFSNNTKFLLFSIIYLVVIFLISGHGDSGIFLYLTYFIWGVISLNIYYAFNSLQIFISITRQSATVDN